MKKRVGSKLYDTETSEFIKDTVFGKLYRKKTRSREFFMVYNDGNCAVMPDEEAQYWVDEPISPKATGSSGYMVRIDKDVHEKIEKIGDIKQLSNSGVIRQLVDDEIERLEMMKLI